MYLRRNSKIRTEVSFDEPLNIDWDGNELLLSDVLGTENDTIYRNIEEQVDRKLLHKALDKLSERERMIMELRFGLVDGDEKTQKDVADLLGISQSYISRLEKGSLNGCVRNSIRWCSPERACTFSGIKIQSREIMIINVSPWEVDLMTRNKVEICGVDTAKLPVLTNAEMRELFHSLQQDHVRSAREKLVNGNLRLVLSVIQRFNNRGSLWTTCSKSAASDS